MRLFLLSLFTIVSSKIINYCPYHSDIVIETYKDSLTSVTRGKTCKMYSGNGYSDNDFVFNDTIMDNYQCYTSVKNVDIGILVDTNYYKLYRKTKHVLNNIEDLVQYSNDVLVSQFNIKLNIKHIAISKKWKQYWDNIECKQNPFQLFDQFRNHRPLSTQEIWVLMSYCPEHTTLGVAGIGGSFSMVNTNEYITFLHEIGHNLGAKHHDDYGVMGPVRYINEILQFNKITKNDICNRRFTHTNQDQLCGNGIVEVGEECECKKGRLKCDCCINCKLKGQCDSLHNQCCHKCQFKNTFNKCNMFGHKGYCANGHCLIPQKCFVRNMEYCKSHDRCKVSCLVNNKCNRLENWGFTLNNIADGAYCDDNKLCERGVCL